MSFYMNYSVQSKHIARFKSNFNVYLRIFPEPFPTILNYLRYFIFFLNLILISGNVECPETMHKPVQATAMEVTLCGCGSQLGADIF